MVTLGAQLLCLWLHHLSRHLSQAHLLLMSLTTNVLSIGWSKNKIQIQIQNKKLQQDVCKLQKQLIYMETYSRRENVK